MPLSSSWIRLTPTRSCGRASAGAIRAGSRAAGWRPRPGQNNFAFFTTIPITTTRSWTRSEPQRKRRGRERSWRARECRSISGIVVQKLPPFLPRVRRRISEPTLPRRAFRRRLQFQEFRLVLRVGHFETRDVLHQALGGEAEEIIAELGILEVELEQPVVGDGQHLAVFEAFNRCGPLVVRIDEAKLAEDASRRQLDADLLDQKISAYRVEHLLGDIAFVKENV